MTEIRSFKGYIEKQHYDDLWDMLFDFVAENPDKFRSGLFPRQQSRRN